jgi:hypothetical protein
MNVKAKARPGKLIYIAAAGVVAFIVVQFVRPQLTNPPVTADLAVPLQVKQILRNSCYDCHSNETKLLWFDHVVPAYWIVAKDVDQGRKHLNFSELGKLPPDQQKAWLYEAVAHIMLGAMPPKNYAALHPGSRITPEKLAVLKEYLTPYVAHLPANTAQIAATDEQFDKWTHANSMRAEVRPAPNGISFMPDYKDWKTISSTERADNHTLRVILGNDLAINALAADHVNPWPDGTKFAKVAWKELEDDQGGIRPGEFFQVEFMIKDNQKYASTLGWGFARWRGTDLQPYGKSADFASECVGCHTPMRDNDFVFTTPIRGEQ